ncbi:MAG: PhnD/SsuA/transferrin family substrate-binding protein [Woeseiaceae bacterium]|nr:PhnD/SsuA/transferrin family substrate-binding protein [Woeseiaceae bacterium]
MRSPALRIGGVPEHFNLPWRLAVADDAFAVTPVRFTEVPQGTGELTRALRDDELDVALVLTEGATLDVLKNDTNRLVKVWVDSPLTWGIHVAADSDIRSIGQARGRRVAISRYGSGSHLISIVDALERGWPVDNMTFVVVDNLDGARDALRAGDADVFLWEKHMTQPLVDNGEFRRIGVREVPWPAFVVSVRRNVLAARAADIRHVLDIAARYARNLKRRASAPRLVADTYGLALRDAQAWHAEVRWSAGYRRPSGALRKVVTALRAQHAIGRDTVSPDRIWQPLPER